MTIATSVLFISTSPSSVLAPCDDHSDECWSLEPPFKDRVESLGIESDDALAAVDHERGKAARAVADRLDQPLERGHVHPLDLQPVAVPRVRRGHPVGYGCELGLQVRRQGGAALFGADVLAKSDGIPDNFAVLAVVELRRSVRQDLHLHTTHISRPN